ncbi:hypothetical protein [Sphingomonas abietis]|uniref:DUF2306 domain-containing protein n=1 Tax=Sphingomonas abietis TaxID=3012344 RepID=A0ABY7NMD2_9SPHN|nr:hypothetical protein [Sphingomonas abietis]WBO21646.1 hypothetical protein PBT88_15900 [Sphingomonas abietis]
MGMVVLIGFSPSWFLRPFLGAPPHFGPLSPLLIVHGIVFTTWIVLTIVQPLLIAAGNRALHRSLGYAGAGLAAAMVVLMVLATIESMRGGVPPVFPTPYAFFAINLVGAITFAIVIGLAIARRREAETHKRLILLSLVVLTTPALARIPALHPFMPFSAFASPDLIIVAGILFDRITRGRVHRVWKIGGPLLIASQILMFPLGFTPMMQWLGDMAMRLPV